MHDTNRRASYAVVSPANVPDWHDSTDVPGEFRHLTAALGTSQLSASYVVVPPHTDFERGTGHRHERLEECYFVSSGTLTMRVGDDVLRLPAPVVVRVDPSTPRSHRNEDDEPVQMWVVSRLIDGSDSEKLPDFWEESPYAVRRLRNKT